MLIPITPHGWQPSSHNEPAISGIGSAMSSSAQPPIAEHDNADFFSSPPSPPLVAEHEEYSFVLSSIRELAAPNTLYPHRDAASDLPSQKADPLQWHPTWAPVSHHASGLRLRLTTAGFH